MEFFMLKVNEIFGPTIQGEGRSAGMPVAFLRLALCNLHCSFCDTTHTWRFNDKFKTDNPTVFNRHEEVHLLSNDTIVEKLVATGMKALVISGGEPFLQQKDLTPLLAILKSLGWWIEIETNGTIEPRREFVRYVDQINCSPKLSNAGDAQSLRIVPTALRQLVALNKTNFKFVIATSEDISEVLHLVFAYRLNEREIRLMPECQTLEELMTKGPWVCELARKNNFIYCTRLSIMMAGTTRGV